MCCAGEIPYTQFDCIIAAHIAQEHGVVLRHSIKLRLMNF